MGVEDAKRIVLIGPDCSGKSSLAKGLSDHYGVTWIPNRRISDDLDAVDSVLDFTRHIIRDNENGFIMDQWQYPVDIVYNKTLRDTASPMEHIEPLILPYLHDYKVLFIHVDADSNALSHRFAKRGDELWDLEQILKVAQAYRDYFRNVKIPYRYINTSFLDKESVVAAAIETIEHYYEKGE